jgi:hypothetical protein
MKSESMLPDISNKQEVSTERGSAKTIHHDMRSQRNMV